MGEAIDTSGYVPMGAEHSRAAGRDLAGINWRWSDFSLFEQGYVEALLTDLDRARMASYRAAAWGSKGRSVPIRPAFSWLSPEALAMILVDCECAQHPDWTYSAHDGWHLWSDRQAGKWATLPPLRVSLSDDGKVHLSAQSQGSDDA